VEIDQPAWSQAAAIILELAKRKVPLHVSPEYVFMFGPSFSPNGSESTRASINTQPPTSPIHGDWDLVAQSSETAIRAHPDPVAEIVRPGSKWAHIAYLAGPEILLRDVAVDRWQAQPGGTAMIQVHGVASVNLTTHFMLVARLISWDGKIAAQTSTPVSPLDRAPDVQRGDVLDYEMPIKIPSTAPRGLYHAEVSIFSIPQWQALPMTRVDAQRTGPMPAGTVLIASPDFQPATNVDIARSLTYSFGDTLGLVGMSPPKVSPTHVDFDLYWRATQTPPANYTIFVQILDGEGKLVAQSDSYPWNGGYPTAAWKPGQIVRDSYSLRLPDGIPPGTYSLITGAYVLETMQRLNVVDASGSRAGDFVPLTRIDVGRS
jgi:hypothetical protein